MSIRVIKAGLLDTIQDGGRYGFRHLGVNPSGAMDKYAMQVSNMLIGNDPGEAVIELHFPAAAFIFTKPALIALAGADLSPSMNGEEIPNLHPILVGKNDVLQFHRPVDGARTYLAVKGGFEIPSWLNSRSTHLKAKAGGWKGRALQKDDEIPLRETLKVKGDLTKFSVLHWKADVNFLPGKYEMQSGAMETGILPGSEWERLSQEGKDNLLMTSFPVTHQADRMGYRLGNIPLPMLSREELVSAAVDFGTLQLLPDGKLILLMADHQSTGGYPRIAHVISAHHSRLAQMKAGDRIRFALSSQEEAEDLLQRQEHHLHQLRDACGLRLDEYFRNTG